MSDTSAWRVVVAGVCWESPRFRVFESKVRRPDGTLAEYFTLDFPRPAVSVLARDASDRVLLIRQHRFIVGRDVWALPSGGVEADETPELAACREFREETGLALEAASHLLSYYPTYGVANQVFHCYAGTVGSAGGAFDRNEVEEVRWFSMPEVKAMVLAGAIPDGFSLTPLLYAWSGIAHQAADESSRCRRVIPTP